MPIFARGVPKDKLTILFFSHALQADATKEQLYRAMVENDCMSYFDFQNAVYELEEDGFLAAIPRAFGQGYRVSAKGEDILSMFLESLPFSLRERLNQYAEDKRSDMQMETQLVSTMQEQQNDAYLVHLRAQENTNVVLDIAMRVASRDMAQRMRKNWEKESPGVYMYLIEHLLAESNEQ